SIYKNYDVEIAKSELLATLPTPEAVLAALPNTVRVDLKSCEDACQKDTRCVAYTFNKWNGRCFLKKGLGLLMRFDPAAISGIVRGYSAPRFSEVTEITRGAGIRSISPIGAPAGPQQPSMPAVPCASANPLPNASHTP